MHASIREPKARLAQAVALERRIPKFGDRDTVQESTDHGPSAVDCENGDHNPTDDAHAVCGEDTEVLQ